MYCVCSEYNGLVRNEYLTVEININSMHISKCENHKIEKHVVFLISKIGTTALISAKWIPNDKSSLGNLNSIKQKRNVQNCERQEKFT